MPNKRAGLPQQAAAVAVRWKKDTLEVCLIRKTGSRNWGVPKGLVDPGDTREETALKEAWEEAGISGRLVGKPLGTYQYDKWDATFEVTLYLMEVLEQHARWQEAGFRERRWTSFDEAASLLSEHPVYAFLDRARILADSIGDRRLAHSTEVRGLSGHDKHLLRGAAPHVRCRVGRSLLRRGLRLATAGRREAIVCAAW